MTKVTLGSILTPEKRPIDLGDGAEEYPLVGVKWWGKGGFLREHKPGNKIRKKRHYVLKKGDVFYNKLFAWRGAFAIVVDELDGCFVSDKFPTYRLNSAKINPKYLELIFTSKYLAKKAEKVSTGSAAISKFTLNPPRFLELDFFLPNLNDQDKIVEIFELIDSELGAISERLNKLSTLLSNVEGFVTESMTSNFERAPLSELGALINRPVTIKDDEMYRQITIGMNNKGIRFRGEKIGSEIGVKNQNTALSGDVVFSRIDIRHGAIGFLPEELDGSTVARDFPVYKFSEKILKSFAELVFKTPDFRAQSLSKSAGSTNRKKMRRDSFVTLEIPISDIKKQKTVVESLSLMNSEVGSLSDRLTVMYEELSLLRDSMLNEICEMGKISK